MIVALMVAVALAAGSQPKDELPRYYDTYPDQLLVQLLSDCTTAGTEMGHDPERVEAYCVCHVLILTQFVPFEVFKDLEDKGQLTPLFRKATQMCVSMGLSPVKPKPKSKPQDKKHKA